MQKYRRSGKYNNQENKNKQTNKQTKQPQTVYIHIWEDQQRVINFDLFGKSIKSRNSEQNRENQ